MSRKKKRKHTRFRESIWGRDASRLTCTCIALLHSPPWCTGQARGGREPALLGRAACGHGGAEGDVERAQSARGGGDSAAGGVACAGGSLGGGSEVRGAGKGAVEGEAHESKVQALDVPPGRRRAKCSTDLLPETAAKGRQLAVEANPVALGDVAAAGGANVVGKGAVAGSPRAPRCFGCVIC